MVAGQAPVRIAGERSEAIAASPDDAGTAGWLLLVIPGVIWGASFLFIAEGLDVDDRSAVNRFDGADPQAVSRQPLDSAGRCA